LIFRIKVISMDGMRMSKGAATIRMLVKACSEILQLGYIPFFFDKKWRQTLHDRAAGTIVVQKIKRSTKEMSRQPLDSFD
jgi:uncharacterized RDD family membrane protein YckC